MNADEHLPWEEPSVTEPKKRGRPKAVTETLTPVLNEEDATFTYESTTEEAPVPETGLITIPPAAASQHVIVGMGTLAAMSAADYEARKTELITGMDRLKDLIASILQEGEDYGKVPGIGRPFLHQPGAEKLCNFFGLAVRQEAERVDGRKALVRVGDVEQESGEWLSPPFAYKVTSFVHLGDFDGPIVAQGYGEANVWEEKYRYRNSTPTCPKCGRPDLIKRKQPENLAGKWQCPSWGGKGGCNSVFEPNDPSIGGSGKVENPDPFGLGQTILLMAAKRSLVAATRRATNTSGLFSQDDDSPSVKQQSDAAPFESDDDKPKAEKVTTVKAEAGGKEATASTVQLRELVALSKENDLGPAGIAALMKRVLGKDVGETSKAVSDAAKTLTANEIGKLLHAIQTGEVPEDPTPAPPKKTKTSGAKRTTQATTTSGTPNTATTPAATSTGADDGFKVDTQEADPGWPPQSADEM